MHIQSSEAELLGYERYKARESVIVPNNPGFPGYHV